MVQPKNSGPIVVEGLETYADERFYSAHEILADETIGGTMTRMSRIAAIGSMSTDSIVGVDVRHPDEAEEKHAVLVGYPFANDHQPHMQLRLDLAQRSLEEPIRFIGLPNNAVGNHYYNAEAVDTADIDSGDFAPLANLIGRMIHRQGIERVDLLGYSQGASLFASLIKANRLNGYFNIRSAMLGDPPNVMDRTKMRLIRDFSSTGTGPFEKAVRDSALETLEDAQAIRFALQKPRQILGLAKFGLSLTLPENYAILGGMSQDRFVDDMSSAVGVEQGVVAHAEHSLIAPKSVMAAATFPDQFKTFEIKGYGHEAADNIATHALLAKMAIEGQPA